MEKNFDYHLKQFDNIKRSTVQFVSWLGDYVSLEEKRICDMACGAGANTFYLADKYPSSSFVGVDYDDEILHSYEKVYHAPPPPGNLKLIQGDWYNLSKKHVGSFDGVISFQTLSWLSDYKEPIEKLCNLQPEWIAISSLFYEGKINYYISIDDHEDGFDGWGKDGKSYYNIYSLPLVKDLFAKNGYKKFYSQKFNIDVDLPKPDSKRMQTYTVTTKEGERLQISGALLMPWYFILAKKE